MECLHLYASDLIDPQTEVHFAFIKDMKYTAGMHCHDFFELFLITGGGVMHNVNNASQLLKDGSLVFIRPDDTHYYQKVSDDCQMINLAFPKATIDSLFNYLGEGFLPGRLLEPLLPPTALLSRVEKATAISRLEKLNTISCANKAEMKFNLRALLVDFFIRYFPVNTYEGDAGIPEWLEEIKFEMQKKENFVKGMACMQEIACKSQEHLCRMFKKHYKMTPSEFINGLRVNYASNLLIHSDGSIIDIAMEAGFENLSHFYHVFKRNFDESPSHFRKRNKKAGILL